MTSRTFTYEKPKVIQALRYHFISRKEIKFMLIVVNLFALLAAGLFYAKVIKSTPFLVSSLLWFFLMIILWYVLPLTVYKQSRTFQDSFRAILGSDRFAIENDRGYKDWQWNEFSTWTESPHFFHLYFNPRSFFIIPKDAFKGDDEHEARKILREKIKLQK